ncbi:MAG: UDP-N-acetylmuramoyl-L-alanine--D-glutamate ligase [Desulfovibrio sp.]
MDLLPEDIRNREQYRDRKTVVVGAGRSGRAAAALLAGMGARVLLADTNESLDPTTLPDLGSNVRLELGPHTREQFAGAELVVLSPGVPVKRMAEVLADVPAQRVVSELELGSWFTQCPILAITGTNGKTTTTTLVGEILRKAGRSVFVGGNIGTPLCELPLSGERTDVVVLEVSSFQLQNVRLFQPQVAVLLNFAPNHLDYHENLEEYLSAKLNLFARMDKSGAAILPEEMRSGLAGRDFTRARRIWFSPDHAEAATLEAPHLPGVHNRANITAAWLAVKELGVTLEQAAAALREFHPLAHRQQPVAEKHGVRFVDDSKATTLDAVCAALRSFDQPVRLLLGGVFKGGDVAGELAPAMRGRVVQVGLFGASREIFEPALRDEFETFWEPDLEKAVQRLFASARPGDVILLSPATSSFDAYKSYGERGDHFKRIAEALA